MQCYVLRMFLLFHLSTHFLQRPSTNILKTFPHDVAFSEIKLLTTYCLYEILMSSSPLWVQSTGISSLSVCLSVCLHISHIAHNADQSGDTRILSGTIWRSAAYSHSHSSVPTRSRTVAFDVSDCHRSFWRSTQVASLQRKSPGRQQHQDGMAVWSVQQSLLIQNNGLFAHHRTHQWSSPSYSTEQSMWISQKPHNIKISIKIFLYPLLMAMQYIMWMTSCCDVMEWQGWN